MRCCSAKEVNIGFICLKRILVLEYCLKDVDFSESGVDSVPVIVDVFSLYFYHFQMSHFKSTIGRSERL